ncbi:hypothetical protein MMYC01_206057 [Madurella mycetomatis]|uniref:C2H2-type domain-containing protein n=1 Tax=Madurella mycetomatis TaxID=100816 RepID=A0A175W100_9PEZI|nr:hypothetical protein MMYC01_206057 [Madurella mycetomatis]
MNLELLKRAEDWQVRAILIALCDDGDVRRKALDYCEQLTRSLGSSAAPKRKHTPSHEPEPDIAICVQCEYAFTKSDNTRKECQYHNGSLEPDYDSEFWADHDENCHGVIDSDFCREEYPEGFIWSCCDKIGTEPGCRFSRHQCSHPPEDEDDEESEEDDGSEQEGRAKKRKTM